MTQEEATAALQQALAQEPEAEAHFVQLRYYEQELWAKWISAATTSPLCDQRVRDVVALVKESPLSPFYELGRLTLQEIIAHYTVDAGDAGAYRLRADELAQAFDEQRVLHLYEVRAFARGSLIFRIPQPGEMREFGTLFVFARPCRLTPELLRWFPYNDWDSVQAMCDDIGLKISPQAPGQSEPDRVLVVPDLLAMKIEEVSAYMETLPQEAHDALLGRMPLRLRSQLLAHALLEAMNGDNL